MKRGRKKGANKDKVFGCDLVEHLVATSQEIPLVLRSCSDFIEEYGIVDGIYRLSGVSSNTQKLRSEFDSEGTPDLYKDVYLQDIHCVSSLCKAYFRELPNPLLTYQLYDHFAEAVAVQLEDERLVKIKEVLTELPRPNYRTLEYLMRHLVRMAASSTQTNMHARNLAIVWAPNLLRSKDIEASGFNGTAAFMEVRVQSIVVEFILTHVTQLFPELEYELGSIAERRKSLPSPAILPNEEEPFFKAIPFQYPGNMSPGDGPPAMRPYHAIIDGTDKRKGSLKGRKWKSIFNLGGRLHDPRKKNKYTPKEKEKPPLRPAKSMDSLSSGPYTQEDSQHPSTHLSPVATPSGNAEGGPAGGGGVASGYAVTYRRTGGASVSMVSGGGGAQGTYRSLETGGVANADKSPGPSQVATSKAERRAGMHISGPFSVTVPLHITSGLALGVLQGGRADEEEPSQEPAEEEQPKKVKQENAEEMEADVDGGKAQTDRKTGSLEDNKQGKRDNMDEGDGEKEVKREEGEAEEARPEEREDSGDKNNEGEYSSEEEESNERQHAAYRTTISEDTDGGDYMDMRAGVIQCPKEEVGQSESLVPLSQEEEYSDHELPLDFQDTFGFLDQMDITPSNQLNEFSVEPPAYEEEEDEEEDNQSPLPSHPDLETLRLNLPPHINRPLPGKSHSLPYKSCPLPPDLSFSSDEDDYSGPDNDEDDSDSEKDIYEDMFYKSLPSASHFQGLNWTSSQNTTLDSDSSIDSHNKNQSECLNQTHTVELPEDIQDSPSVHQSGTDTEMIANNGIDAHAVDQCLNGGDLDPLPLETEHLSVEEKNEDRSTKDEEEESGLDEAGHVDEPTQEADKELESTDIKEETLTCRQEDEHSIGDENQEDTYFGPDTAPTLLEPGNVETSCTIDQPVINEEHASSDGQQESPEGHLVFAESETVTDTSSSEILASQDKIETDKLLEEAKITLHSNMQGQTDSSELGKVVPSGEMEVGEKGEEKKDERETVEETVMKRESVESEHTEGEKSDEGPMQQADVDETEKESDMVPQEQQTNLERDREDAEKMAIEKQKECREGEEENDQQLEENDVEEEIEAEKDSHLEGVTEIKEGSVPEELSEGEDRLLEDGEEQQSEKEKEKVKEEKHAEPSTSDSEKPLRPPRMKEREGERGAGLGPGVGRTVIISKHKIYQVKAVPVVPPKPQHSKITAFRQQFQQRDTERQQKHTQHTPTESQHTDIGLVKKEKETEPQHQEQIDAEEGDVAQNHDYQSTGQGKGTDRERLEENKAGQVKKQLKDAKTCNSFERELAEDREEQKQRRGTWDGGSLKKDGEKESDRETKKASGISMCFDEAVARATGKRCKEKESMEKDRFIDLQWERSEQKEGPNQTKREEEEKTD